MSIRIKRVSITSPSACSLKHALSESNDNVKLLRKVRSTWVGSDKSLLINWGSSETLPTGIRAKVLNKPEHISKATNKLSTFTHLANEDITIPWYTEKHSEWKYSTAYQLLSDDNLNTLFFRTTSTGYGGEGIYPLTNIREKVVENSLEGEFNIETIEDYLEHLQLIDSEWSEIINNTKFISAYFKAKDEYRVHVICGGVAFSQRKALRTDDERPENPNFLIRNHSNGFIFQQNNVEIPDLVKEASVKAVKALGLDFGAVDIRYNTSTQEYCILEINTAPAISGNTLTKYSEVFSSVYKVINDV